MEKETVEKTTTVVINGQEKIVERGELTFEEIVRYALNQYDDGDTVVYTVLYFKGHSDKPKGQLVKGESLKVHNGMVINVTRTNRS